MLSVCMQTRNNLVSKEGNAVPLIPARVGSDDEEWVTCHSKEKVSDGLIPVGFSVTQPTEAVYRLARKDPNGTIRLDCALWAGWLISLKISVNLFNSSGVNQV